MKTTPVALSIAGSDSSGGAGIQADLRAFSATGVYGTTVLTALTAQNPGEVTAVVGCEPSFVRAQIDTVFAGLPVAAVKTGMLWSAEVIESVLIGLESHAGIPLVVDTVMVASSGAKLLNDDAIDLYRKTLIPKATLITPNIDEANLLLDGATINANTQVDSAKLLADKFDCSVLLKGGHLEGDPIDILVHHGEVHRWQHTRVHHVDTHGSGCTLSAAITAHLARGSSLPSAVDSALKAVNTALQQPTKLTDELSLLSIEANTRGLS